MTDHTDLIARLRKFVEEGKVYNPTATSLMAVHLRTLSQAATALEALSQREARLVEALTNVQSLAGGDIVDITLGDTVTDEMADAFKDGFRAAMSLVAEIARAALAEGGER